MTGILVSGYEIYTGEYKRQGIYMKRMLLVMCMTAGLFWGLHAVAGAANSPTISSGESTPAVQTRCEQISQTHKLCLVWQQQFEDSAVPLGGDIPTGVTVVSPCWFEITSDAGDIGSQQENHVTPDKAYIERVHKAGCQAWPLLTNSFDSELTSRLLRNPEGQRKAIHHILALCQEYDLDGINLDFENIADADRSLLSSFVAAIANALHQENKVVSIDVTVPSEQRFWSPCYDRKALAMSVDYVILMAYDEHSAISAQSGSVASLPWVERGIEAVLAEGVPSAKLVLGMPLYMRLWSESHGEVRARTLSMPAAERLLREKNLVPVWLKDVGQYYFEYTEDGTRYQVWQENARSLALKSALVNRYDLAGGALWKSGVETKDVWEVLLASLRNAER